MLMSERSTHLEQTLFPLIAGVGLGMLFHAPYQVFTRALRRQEVASGTSAFFLVRFTGATVGLVSVLLLRTFRACSSDRAPSRPSRALCSSAGCRARCRLGWTPQSFSNR